MINRDKIVIILYNNLNDCASMLSRGRLVSNPDFVFSDHIRTLHWQKKKTYTSAGQQAHCHNMSNMLYGRPWRIHDETLQQRAIGLYLQLLYECREWLIHQAAHLDCLVLHDIARQCINIVCMSIALNFDFDYFFDWSDPFLANEGEMSIKKQLIYQLGCHIQKSQPSKVNEILKLYVSSLDPLPTERQLCYVCDQLSHLWNAKIASNLLPRQQAISIAVRVTELEDDYYNIWMQNIAKFWQEYGVVDLTTPQDSATNRKIEIFSNANTVEALRCFAQKIEQAARPDKDIMNIVVASSKAHYKIATSILDATYYQNQYVMDVPEAKLYFTILNTLLNEDIIAFMSLLQHSAFIHKQAELCWQLEQHIRNSGENTLTQISQWLHVKHSSSNITSFIQHLQDAQHAVQSNISYTELVQIIQQLIQTHFDIQSSPLIATLLLSLPIATINANSKNIVSSWEYVMQEFIIKTTLENANRVTIITDVMEHLYEAEMLLFCANDAAFQEQPLSSEQHAISRKIPAMTQTQLTTYRLGQLNLTTSIYQIIVSTNSSASLASNNPLLQYIISVNNLKCKHIALEKKAAPVYPEKTKAAIVLPYSEHPKSISVTSMGLLIQNPAIFSLKHILKLKQLNSFSDNTVKRNFGIAVHRIAKQIANNIEQIASTHAAEIFIENITQEYHHLYNFMERKAIYNCAIAIHNLYQSTLLQGGKIFNELPGNIKIGNIDIVCIADSIIVSNGKSIIYDFKTGTYPTAAEELRGINPQLLCEALIFKHDGFPEILHNPSKLVDLCYVSFENNTTRANLNYFSKARGFSLDAATEQVHKNLQELLTFYYQSCNPYVDLGNYTKQDRPYLHLLRSESMIF